MAVKQHRRDLVEALLVQGADPVLKNKVRHVVVVVIHNVIKATLDILCQFESVFSVSKHKRQRTVK